MKGASAAPSQKLGSAVEIDCGREDRPLPAAAAAAIKSALPLLLPIHLLCSCVTPPHPKRSARSQLMLYLYGGRGTVKSRDAPRVSITRTVSSHESV